MKKEELKKLILETVIEGLENDEKLQELFGLNTPGVSRGIGGALRGKGSVGGSAPLSPADADAALKKLAAVVIGKIQNSAEGAQLKPGDLLSNAEQIEVLNALNAKTGGKFGENVGQAFQQFVRGMVQPALKHTQIQEGVVYSFKKKA